MNKNVISLFSGAGGLDIGLEKAGLTIKVCQEWNRQAVETLVANGRNVVPGSIEELIKLDPSCSFLLEYRPFALVGGPPCQSFSSTGKGLGLKDKRGRLFRSFVKAVLARQPRFFVMENVAKLAGKKHKPVLLKILRSLRAIGYSVDYCIFNAADFGAPQNRKRIIIIGSRDHEPIIFPIPTHKGNHRTFGDAVQGMKDNGEGTQFSEKTLRLIKLVPEGGWWKHLPLSLQKEATGNAKGKGFTGIMRRVSFSKPLPTLMAGGPKQRLTLLAHPTEDRPLTVMEYSRGQGFPDEWKFQGKTADKYKQIGNAVPIALGQAIGEALLLMGK